MYASTNTSGTRDARLPTEDGGHADRSPHRAPCLLRVVWANPQGVKIEATLETNRTRKRWFYNECFAKTGDASDGFGRRICTRATSSRRVAQGWANGMSAMGGVVSIEV